VIDGGSLETERLTDAHCRQDIENDLRLLASVTTELYNQRRQSGILTQLRDELTFDFDSDLSTLGVSVVTKPISTHRIVKELLLLANISVAQKISSRLPEQALLRRHASPVDRKIVSATSFELFVSPYQPIAFFFPSSLSVIYKAIAHAN
jgi:protein SSD1